MPIYVYSKYVRVCYAVKMAYTPWPSPMNAPTSQTNIGLVFEANASLFTASQTRYGSTQHIFLHSYRNPFSWNKTRWALFLPLSLSGPHLCECLFVCACVCACVRNRKRSDQTKERKCHRACNNTQPNDNSYFIYSNF